MRFAARLAAAAMTCLSFGAVAATAPPPAADVLQRIDTFAEAERARSRIPGIALAIVHDGRVVALRGYGTRGAGAPMTGETPLPIGSLTKSFTAVLVRQLVDAGRVDVDAPVQRYLPWFTLADAAAARRITVRHLLNQTSGLSRADGMRAIVSAGDADIDMLARSVTALAPTAAPAERFQYSNLNFVLLGALVQAVEGRPWPELVRQRIFEPLDMRASRTAPQAASSMGTVHRYVFGMPMPTALSFAPGLAPTGALVASAEDMARYLTMLLQGGQGPRGAVLSAAAADAMFASASPPGASELLGTEFAFRYGEGWFVGPFGAWSDARWHLGNLASFAAWMVVLPQQRQAVVVLINANHELPFFGASSAFSRIPVGIVDLLSGRPAPTGAGVQAATAKLGVVLLAVTALAGWCCVAAVRSRRAWPSVALALLSVAAAAAVALGAISWRGGFAFAPDLTAWLALLLVVLIAPGAHRLLMVRR